jgi:copper(I)-binding protein
MPFLAVLAAALVWLAPASLAGEYKVGSLTIENPWTRPTIGKMKTGAGYMKIVNKGAAGDTLVSVASPAAGKLELHTHIREGDVMKMRRVEGGIDIPAGGMAELKPGGLHIMLFDLKEPLKEGDVLPMTLSFRNAGSVRIEVKIQKTPAVAPHTHTHKHKH